MKKRVVGFLSVLLVFCLIFSFSAYAHSGRTDSSGGHRDNKNKSGLGGLSLPLWRTSCTFA